jgi:uncharacterized OB-fold protein
MPYNDRKNDPKGFRHWDVAIEATYIYTAGVAGTKFFDALKKQGKILATECKGCKVEYLPPRVYCENCFEDLSDSWHDVGLSGTVAASTVMRYGLDGARLAKPEVRAMVRMGSGTAAILHRVLADPARVKPGAKVKAQLKAKAKRRGDILDIEGFKLL